MLRFTLAILIVILGACSGESPEAQAPTASAASLPEGIWRAEVAQDGRLIPFNLEIESSVDGYRVTYLNGPERMPVEQVRFREDGQLELNFPSYSAGLTATVRDGRMDGTISLVRKNETRQLPFSAVHGQAYRFFPAPAADYADFGGRWEVVITVTKFNFTQPAIALFNQDGGMLSGTVQTQVGDFRFLHGEVRGEDLYLSSFDGSGTTLWLASLQPDGSLRGSFDSVTYGPAEWTARRNAEFQLEDPTTLTVMKPGYESLDFSLPDLNGQPVSLSDERYQDKVVLVILGGSWCPSCHDEAQFMVPFETRYRDQGLEVIYIMFEYSDDFSEAEDQLLAFKKRYQVEHPILFAGDSSRESRGEKLPMLNDILAFPTTLFIDRSGKVRRIHTAFPGPATGQEHEDYKREFRAFVEMLLAEQA
jgi:peroxiredoxin